MTVVLQSVLDVYHGPFSCKWFAFGPAFQDFGKFFLTKLCYLLGVVVEASLVQLMNKFTLFHSLPLLEKYLCKNLFNISLRR